MSVAPRAVRLAEPGSIPYGRVARQGAGSLPERARGLPGDETFAPTRASLGGLNSQEGEVGRHGAADQPHPRKSRRSMAHSQYLGQGPEWLTGPDPFQPLEQPRLERDQAEISLRATYPINIDDLRSSLDVEVIAAHQIAPYLLERTSQKDDR